MDLRGTAWLRRLAAVGVSLALLYFAAGGSLLHQHQDGHETLCHVCHSLHAPLLSVASALPPSPQIARWQLN